MKEENTHSCVCGKSFDNGKSLQAHKTSCKDWKQHKTQQEEITRQEREAKRLPNGLFKCDNPDCTNEHDGSYGSGIFCSRHCQRSFCGKQVKGGAIKGRHQNHAKQRAPYGTWKCDRCNLVFETRAQLFEHNHQVHPIEKGSSWNKGLTKKTDERVAANAKAVSISFKKYIDEGYVNPTWTDEYWTEERRKDQSDKKIKLYKEHPEKHPNRKLANNRKKMTYPEQLAYDFLVEHNIEFKQQYFSDLDGIRRFVDFYVPSKNLFIEIDGEYWHEEGNAADIHKDEVAANHNIRTLRIRYPSMHVIDTLSKEFL